MELTAVRDPVTGSVADEVYLSLVRVDEAYQVPGVLRFGGWNQCPDPELTCAVLREWGQRYGAVPASLTGDVLECLVERPPATPEQAFELACEQWIFCEDIVSQGTETVEGLARELWQAPRWFFWWD